MAALTCLFCKRFFRLQKCHPASALALCITCVQSRSRRAGKAATKNPGVTTNNHKRTRHSIDGKIMNNRMLVEPFNQFSKNIDQNGREIMCTIM